MRIIEKNGLLLIPRVTDMRNGMFRPEVAWSKGRSSDIVFSETFDSRIRAECIADLSAGAAIMNAPGMDSFWADMDRAVYGCRRMIEHIAASVC